MASAASSSSAAAAAPPPPMSTREAKLRSGFEKVLVAWRDRVGSAGGMREAFPALYAKRGKQLAALYDEVWHDLQGFMTEELASMLADSDIPARLRLLESLKDVADGKALPAPSEVLPEDEVRAAVVESKLAHEKQLAALLESLRRENDELEAEVAAADARAQRVTKTLAEYSGLYGQTANACGAFLDGQAEQQQHSVEPLDDDAPAGRR